LEGSQPSGNEFSGGDGVERAIWALAATKWDMEVEAGVLVFIHRIFYSNMENLALWTRSETNGSA
jgi:hypothetical protein